MQSFVDRHQDLITGVLTGFDRVLFRGNLQSMFCLYQGCSKVRFEQFVPRSGCSGHVVA